MTENVKPNRQLPLAATILLLTAAAALLWGHHKLMWVDEISVIESAGVGKLSELVRIQHDYPVALDPLLYQATAHLFTRILGVTAFAIRLPSLFGFLALQTCQYLLVQKIAGARAALIAMLLPALSGTLYYAAEARPYGMLLGIFALAAWSYQGATRAPRRGGYLAALALSLALAPNTHYFGVLLFVPIGLAEGTRILQRRCIDWPILVAIALGVAGLAGIVPFQPAVARFRLHYYNADTTSLSSISNAYQYLLVNYSLGTWPRRLLLLVLLGLTVAAIASCVRFCRRHPKALPLHELVLLLGMASIPVLGYGLSKTVTHGMEPRYVLGGIVGIAALLSIGFAPLFERSKASLPVTAALILLCTAVISARLHAETQTTRTLRAQFVVPNELKAKLLASPDTALYFQEGGTFQVASYYEPDSALRDRFVLLYSFDEEMRFRKRETASLAADHLRRFTALRILPYEQLKATPGPHNIVRIGGSWDWSPEALAKDNAHTVPLGKAFGGTIVATTFPRCAACL